MRPGIIGAQAARCSRGLLLAAALSVVPAFAPAATPADPTFRLFLKNGRTITSYGEYARVGDRVVFSTELGASAGQPRLQLVSLPSSDIDWTRTEQYSDAVRCARYASTLGESDFAALTARVASALSVLSATPDPARRLEIVQQMRREVADWPRAHYGYRSTEIAQIGSLLDEALSELRAATGSREFDLKLVASLEPPATPLLPPPTPAEAIEQVLSVVPHVSVPAERLSLLQNVIAYMDESSAAIPAKVLDSLRRSARRSFAAQMTVEDAYRDLARKTIADVSLHALRGDVRAVEKALGEIARADERLGRKRSDQIAALVATVEERLDTARRLRLARDQMRLAREQWARRVEECRDYRGQVNLAIRDLARARRPLEDIKTLAGPSVPTLLSLAPRLARVATGLSAITPPPELSLAHAMLLSATELARQAVQVRQDAVRSAEMALAWNASAAAAGSMMLLARARADMDTFFKPPEFR